MYDEDNKHCKECLCNRCEGIWTDNCIEGKCFCSTCENDDHVVGCVGYGEGE